MKKLKPILFLRSFGKTIQDDDLVSQQRFRLFKITTLFALFIFAVGIYQVAIADIDGSLFIVLMSVLFIGIFINYFALGIHKKPAIAYTILLALGFAVIHIISYGQGGVRNSGMFYLGALILAAFMLLGKTGGKGMAGISVVHVVYFYFLSLYTDWTNYSFIGTDPGLIDMDFLITGSLSVLIITAQANYLEKSKNAITDDIKSKRDELVFKNSQLISIQEDLETKNKELEQKNKELEQFVYIASHDLQEPLRTVSSFVDLLRQQYHGKLDAKGDKYLNYILESSDRMKTLINELLDYSRIGSKKQLQPVDCNLILQEVIADLGTTMGDNQAEVSGEQLPVIKGYPAEIKQLFQNLITNAIKFRKKGTIPEVSITALRDKGNWIFSVRDNGIGIVEHHKERIFVIFQRLHNRAEYEGSGIGLAHCKKIVGLHDGDIWVDSIPGNGATFHFTIPENRN